jgi:LysM repeat protein
MLATSQAYAGGAWGNARKAIEEGFFGGKNSEAHRGTVLGSTIGEPLRDAIGPALHSLMTLAGVVVLVLLPASVVLRLSDIAGSPLLLGVLAVCVALLVVAILYVKREGEPMSPVRRVKTVGEEVRGALLVLVVAVVGAVAFAWGGSGSLKAIQPLRSLDMLPIAAETPSPTTTATPQATTTPWPTYTPLPTYTPPPTYTPLPTYTPVAASPTVAITTTEPLTPTIAIPETGTPAPEQPADTPAPEQPADTPAPEQPADTPAPEQPADTPAPEQPATTTHTVQPGDTLAAIAEQYGITTSALMEANNLTPAQANSLQVGQELIIPAP